MKTVNSTGRVIDPRKAYCKAIKEAVAKYDRKKEYKKNHPKGFRGVWKTTICSQCKRGMRKDLANLQIENKRENAPICMACIMGYKRKPKSGKTWKPETQKKFNEITYK